MGGDFPRAPPVSLGILGGSFAASQARSLMAAASTLSLARDRLLMSLKPCDFTERKRLGYWLSGTTRPRRQPCIRAPFQLRAGGLFLFVRYSHFCDSLKFAKRLQIAPLKRLNNWPLTNGTVRRIGTFRTVNLSRHSVGRPGQRTLRTGSAKLARGHSHLASLPMLGWARIG